VRSLTLTGARRSRRRLLTLVVAAALVTACSSGGDSERADTEATTSTDAPATSGTDGAGGDGDQAPADDVLRLGFSGVETLDPALISPASISSVMLVDLLHDTLTRLDADGVPQTGLARFTPNEDLTVWRFELTEEATFADGRAIEAADVVNSLDRIRGLGGQSFAAIGLEDVQAVVAVEPPAVEVTLAAPSAVLPELLASPLYGILDRNVAPGAVGAPINPSGEHTAEADGPGRLVLERRHGQGPSVIDVRLYADDGAAYDAFVAGGLDWAPVPVDRLGDAEEQVGLDGLVPFHASVLLGVNPSIEPTNQPGLRRAVALAVDRQVLSDAVFGATARPMPGLIPRGVPGAAEECIDPCGPDVAAARWVLAETYPESEPPPLRLLTDRTSTHEAIAGILEDQLGAAGLTLAVNPSDDSTYTELLGSGQQQLFLYSALGVGRSAVSHLQPWASGSPDNTTGYANEGVDMLLVGALAEPDRELRLQRWREAEAAILGDVPVIPIAQLRTVAALRPRVSGLVVHVDGSVDVSGVTFAAPAG
jgi:ABC-type transport system substrate-binding protein